MRTLDGKNTFYGMGMIAVSTKLNAGESIQERRLQRPKKKLRSQEKGPHHQGADKYHFLKEFIDYADNAIIN